MNTELIKYLPDWLDNPAVMEAKVPLLGKSITFETAKSYHARITALYHDHTKKEVLVKGKITTTPTKKRIGVYSITYENRSSSFEFDKTKTVKKSLLTALSKTLDCSEEKIKSFLDKKKFDLI